MARRLYVGFPITATPHKQKLWKLRYTLDEEQ